jgi:hypothetical protein
MEAQLLKAHSCHEALSIFSDGIARKRFPESEKNCDVSLSSVLRSPRESLTRFAQRFSDNPHFASLQQRFWIYVRLRLGDHIEAHDIMVN